MPDPDACVSILSAGTRSAAPNGSTGAVDDFWMRFAGDPLASVSERFPLASPDLDEPGASGKPSAPETRPFGLRVLRDMGSPSLRAYRYCHERQLTVGEDGRELPAIVDKLDWTTISHGDGDEGPDKDYAWETVPDDDSDDDSTE